MTKMEVFEAVEVTGNKITLLDADQLGKLYKIITEEDQFIIQWHKDGKIHSKVMVTTNLSAKLKNGELELVSVEGKEESK